MPDVNELISTLRELFYSKCNSDNKLQSIAQKLAEGTYSDAHDYSVRVGELLSEAFSEVFTEEIYPELTQEIARQIIPSLLGSDHRMISDACVTVQEHLNQNAGIGLKPIEPEFDVSRAYDLADKYVSYDEHEKAKWVLGEPVENYSQSVVDDSIRRNADFQWKAGMSPKIVRKAEAGACKWCRSLAGTYDYAGVQDTGNDVYRRHENCRCEVTYDPGDGKKQDVWSKNRYSGETSKSKRISEIVKLEERQKRLGLENKENRINGIYNPFEDNDSSTGYSDHIRERQRKEDRNISDRAIERVIRNPLHKTPVIIDEKGRPYVKYIGERITVIINPDDNTRITVIKTPPNVRKRWKKKNSR